MPLRCTGVKGKGLGVQAPKPIWFFHWKKLLTFGRGSYGWGVTCLGHAHPVIIKALREQEEMEEIYFIVRGEGEMTVDTETRHVVPGDAIWIPAGSLHALANSDESEMFILVVASPNW